jgi:hypothetical protein
MFLSKSQQTLLFAAIFALLLQGCGSYAPTLNKDTPRAGPRSGSAPFPTREPTVFQGDLIVSNGTTEERYFVARKDDKWRFDTYRDGATALTQLRSDKVYTIDHAKKAYAVEAYADLKDFDTGYFNALSWHFFRGANYIDHNEIGRDGTLVRYKARMLKDSKNDVVVTIDEATGVMVRQEITSQKERNERDEPVVYVFEVRGLKLEVDDEVFEIPAGYRRTANLEGIPLPSPKQ